MQVILLIYLKTKFNMKRTLRLILGDQLNHQHSWFTEKNDTTFYIMMEMRQETDYVHHHIQKIIAFFTAMRAFSEHLREQGHQVIYLKLDDKNNTQSLTKNLDNYLQSLDIQHFEYQQPDEYRLDSQLKEFIKEHQFILEESYSVLNIL